MKKVLFIVILLSCVPALVKAQCPVKSVGRTLIIDWQYTVCLSKDPCERCRMGPEEVRAAYKNLQTALAELEITVVLNEQTDDQGNDRIVINGKSLDKWLNGKLISRSCASCPSLEGAGKKYNVLELDGTVYEVIPADLIIRASLLAASELFVGASAPPCGIKTPCQGCPGQH